MKLNLPFELENQAVLIAGAGGGWDVFGGLPLAYELAAVNRIILANYSSCAEGFDVRLARPDDHPEGKLAAVVEPKLYVFGKGGASQLRAAYRHVVEQEGIDAVILVDGGVDSLMRGDEEGPGSIPQDTLSLLVVNELDVPTRILACVGFGTETEEGVCHYRALENMAALAKDGHFLGACALTPEMEAFRYYENLCRQAFEQPGIRSHVHTRIVPAVHGEFGRYQMYSDADQPLDLLSDRPECVNPLMGLFWFFDAPGVAGRSLLAEHLATTDSFKDVLAEYERAYAVLRKSVRRNRHIPL